MRSRSSWDNAFHFLMESMSLASCWTSRSAVPSGGISVLSDTTDYLSDINGQHSGTFSGNRLVVVAIILGVHVMQKPQEMTSDPRLDKLPVGTQLFKIEDQCFATIVVTRPDARIGHLSRVRQIPAIHILVRAPAIVDFASVDVRFAFILIPTKGIELEQQPVVMPVNEERVWTISTLKRNPQYLAEPVVGNNPLITTQRSAECGVVSFQQGLALSVSVCNVHKKAKGLGCIVFLVGLASYRLRHGQRICLKKVA